MDPVSLGALSLFALTLFLASGMRIAASGLPKPTTKPLTAFEHGLASTISAISDTATTTMRMIIGNESFMPRPRGRRGTGSSSWVSSATSLSTASGRPVPST